ncbi:MAG: RES domain-containing protein [Acidobacteria bacterium]|nr:MAG: RES domain-containing protein [Acidobacteriota bacterium]
MKASQAAIATLPRRAESRTWFRAIQTRHLGTALAVAHTNTVTSRFSGATPNQPGHQILYLAENPMVALLEVQALLGQPTTPGGLVPQPRASWTVLNASVNLQQLVDLTDLAAQAALETSAQELTGDWVGYRLRGPHTTVSQPTGLAPTHELGHELYQAPDLEGFRTLSAKAPYHEALVVFPQKLQPGAVSWFNPLRQRTETLPE